MWTLFNQANIVTVNHPPWYVTTVRVGIPPGDWLFGCEMLPSLPRLINCLLGQRPWLL